MTDKRIFWDRVFAFSSWLIVLALIYAAFHVATVPPPLEGPVAGFIGAAAAQVFYFCLFMTEAGLLAYSKIRKRKKMRKVVLLVIYFTGVFTFLLSWAILGFTPAILDNLWIGLAAGGCFLYWKFKTEYINPEEFYAACEELRDDLPPPS